MPNTAQFLPEWAPVRSVILVWPYPHGDWRVNYDSVVQCYWGILSALSECVDVWLLLHPSLDEAAFKQELSQRAANVGRVRVRVTLYDDTWVRDYGPLSTTGGYISYTFNGWGGKYSATNDNLIPQSITDLLEAQITKFDFICEGGGLETNGETLLLNADCIVDEKRNPGWDRRAIEIFFSETLGARKFAWVEGVCLTGDDTDGHIDTIVRFASIDALVYSGPNSAHVDAVTLEHLHTQVQKLAAENNWRTFALPSPAYQSLVDGRDLPCTYANFLIVNDCVFAPIYGLREDSAAVDVLSQAFPGHKIVPVRCEALLEQHGSLHCATMQIARLA